MIVYIVGVIVLLYVLNRYFSGFKYNEEKPNLKGFVAIVTGGNAGIGKETALALAKQ